MSPKKRTRLEELEEWRNIHAEIYEDKIIEKRDDGMIVEKHITEGCVRYRIFYNGFSCICRHDHLEETKKQLMNTMAEYTLLRLKL